MVLEGENGAEILTAFSKYNSHIEQIPDHCQRHNSSERDVRKARWQNHHPCTRIDVDILLPRQRLLGRIMVFDRTQEFLLGNVTLSDTWATKISDVQDRNCGTNGRRIRRTGPHFEVDETFHHLATPSSSSLCYGQKRRNKSARYWRCMRIFELPEEVWAS